MYLFKHGNWQVTCAEQFIDGVMEQKSTRHEYKFRAPYFKVLQKSSF